MRERIEHEWPETYEYPLPLSEVPPEVDGAWRDWTSAFVGRSVDGVHELFARRFRGSCQELATLSDLVMGFTPFSLLVFEGTPLLWLENKKGKRRDFIYLPPEVSHQEVRAALKSFQLDSNALLVEFFARFGGMGERWPFEEIEFSGRRERGKLIVEPATRGIEAGFEFRTDAENRERRRRFAPWLDGVAFIAGGDSLLYIIGTDGTVCAHENGNPEYAVYFESLAEVLDLFVKGRREEQLFYGAYHSFRGGKPLT